MAIIMDDADHKNKIIMADNGYGIKYTIIGYKATIPSIFLSHKNGEALIDLI